MESMRIVLGRYAWLIAAVAVLFTQDVSATTYYVRPGGNNASDGLSWATAWAHPNRAQSQFTTSGHTLVIAPGSYDTVQFVPPAAGGAQTVYACSSWAVNGSDEGRNNTFIRGGRNQNLTWTSIGLNLWVTTFDSPGGGVVSNNGEYVAFFRDGVTMRPRQTVAELNEQNEYSYVTAGGVTTLYSTTNPNASSWRVSWRPVMFLGRNQSNIMIYGLNISEGSQRLFILSESGSGMPKPDSIYIYHCNLSKVSDLQIAHNTSIVYCGEIGPNSVSDWSNAIEVVGCSLSTVISVGEGTGVHAGSAIEYYFTRDSRIDSNVFVGPMSVAIALKMGCYPDNGNKSLNWSIKYNRISGCVDEAVWFSNKVGNVDFIGNILERNECAVNIHTSSPCGNDPTQGNIIVSHNTFIDNQVNFTASAANAIGGNKVMYNIFSDTVSTVGSNYEYTIGFRLRGGEAPLETPSTETYWANGVNYNMYYSANGGESFSARFTSNSGYAGYPNPTWAQWTAHFDAASVTGVNPKFAASHLGDYSRPNSAPEFNVTEYGRTWTHYGAWQPDSPGCFPLIAAPNPLSPSDGAANQTAPIVFDWSDVAGSTNYRIEIDNNSGFTSPEVSAQSATSTFSTSALLPSTTYYWRVAAFDACGWGNWSTPRSFSTCNAPVAPNYVSPANGATGITLPVVLDWSDLAGVTTYQVQVDDNADFSSTAIDQQVATSTYSASGLTGGPVYYWRVRAQNSCGWGAWTTARSFTLTCTLPAAPTLASPANAATNLAQPIALDWNDVATATGYQIQVDNDSDFSSVTVAPTSTASTYSLSGLATGTTYYWRVQAQSACGLGSFSASRSFTTACNLPAVPSFVSPANGATNLSQPIALDWSDVSGATQYQVQVDNNSDFSSPAADNQPGASTYSVSGLTGGTLFYWRIRALNACGWGSWSASRTFTTSSTDGTPPVISSVTATDITDRSAVITWTTNEAASTQINYGTTGAYGSSTPLVATLTTTHEQVITDLDSLTTYHFRVRSRDAANNEAISSDFVFTTANSLGEGVPPTVSSTYTGFDPIHITDGDYNPYGWETSTWASDSTTSANWIEFNLGTSRTIDRVAVYWAWNSLTNSWMTSREFHVQVWNGSAYVDVATNNNVTVDSCTFAEIAPVATTRVRYYQPANMGPTSYPKVVWLAELDVFSNGLVNSAPTVPGLTSPADAAQLVTLTPTLTLANSSDVDGNLLSYDFQIATSSSFATIVAQATGVVQGGSGSTSWNVSPSLAGGTTYYWRARAFDGSLYSSYSAYRTFTITANTAPTVPTLTSPSAGAQVSTLTPTLTIGNSTDAQGNTITYDIQVSTSSTFGTIAAQTTGLAQGGSGSTSWVVSPNLVTGTTYYWRARAYDGALYSSYAAYQSFSIVSNSAPTTPGLNSPAAAATGVTRTPTLVVNNSTDPDGNTITYEFQVATTSSFSTIVAQAAGVAQGTGTTSWIVGTQLAYSTTYYWRVRANDGALNSPYAAYRSFTTMSNTAPGAPAPTLPLNGSRVIDMTPDLVVNNATDTNGDPLTYQFYLYNEATTVLLATSPMMAPGTGNTAWTTSITLSNKTKYTWRARSNDGSAWSGYSQTRNFRTNRIPLTPVPSAPIDGDTVLGSMHQYVIINSTDPDGDSLTYDFEVYSDSLLTILVESVLGVNPGASQTSAISNVPLNPNQFYWWRARANDSTHSSNWCDAEKFFQSQLSLDVTEAPSIVSPQLGEQINQAQPALTISWTGSSDTSECIFELSRTNNFQTFVDVGTVRGDGNSASWTTDQVLDQGEYYWRAKRGSSDYSVTGNFSVVASIYVSPNPFEYSNESIVVHNLPSGSRFEVYTSSGDRVMSIDNLTGDFNWDVRNSAGEKLGSGVFLWYVRLSDKTISGKLIVQR